MSGIYTCYYKVTASKTMYSSIDEFSDNIDPDLTARAGWSKDVLAAYHHYCLNSHGPDIVPYKLHTFCFMENACTGGYRLLYCPVRCVHSKNLYLTLPMYIFLTASAGHNEMHLDTRLYFKNIFSILTTIKPPFQCVQYNVVKLF